METPVKLSNKQKELLREFEKSVQEGGEHHSPQHASWGDRVKKFFDDLTTSTFRRSSAQFTIWPAVFEPKKPSRKEAQ